MLEDVACYMQRSVDAEGVIHWRSFHNLSQTHKVFCVKKKFIKKDKGEFSKGHNALEKFNFKFFASLYLSLHELALRKYHVRKQ